MFIVNPKSSITNLTTAEVVDLYTGNNTQNLDQSYPSRIYSKGEGHGTFHSFKSYFNLESMPAPLANNQLQFKITGVNTLYGKTKVNALNQVNQAVANVSRQPQAIAYESLGALSVFKKSKNAHDIKLLSLDGNAPTSNQKANQHYPFKRALNLVISATASDAAKQYIEFLLSNEGQKILADNFYIPL